MDSIKKSFSQLGVYSIGNIAIKQIGLILLPLYTNVFSVSEYGKLALYEVSGEFLLAFFSLGINDILSRWYWDKKYLQRQKEIFFNVFFSVIVFDLILFSVILLGRNFIGLAHLNDQLFLFFSISYLLRSFTIYPLLLLRIQLKAKTFVVVNIIYVLTAFSGTLFLILVLGWGLKSIFIAQIIAHALVLIILLPYILSNIEFKLNISLISEILRYSVPLIFSRIGFLIFSLSDRYLLGFITSEFQVGIYSLAAKFASVIRLLLINSFQMGYTHLFFKNMDQDDLESYHLKMFDYLMIILSFCSVALMLFSSDIVRLMTIKPGYEQAIPLIPILTLGFFLYGIYYLFTLIIIKEKKTKSITFIILFSALVNVIWNLVFIPTFSVYGAAAGTLIANIIMVYLAWRKSQQLGPIKYNLKKNLYLFLAVCIIAIICIFDFGHDLSLLRSIVIKTMTLLGLTVLFYNTSFLNAREKQKLVNWVKRRQIS
jgi:O-antigen/teichoic acid export membrane protein